MSCESCRADPITAVYSRQKPLDSNATRHSALFRCTTCCALYEVFPEEKVMPQEISECEARELFPGAFHD